MTWNPDFLVLALSSARLTRLVTTDAVGERYVRRPAHEALARYLRDPHQTFTVYEADNTEKESLPAFAYGGLECPFCVGFWLGAANLGVYAATARHPRARRLWRAVAAPLALNYVVGHLSSRID